MTGECWEWTAGRDADGYGVFYIPPRGHRSRVAHRISFEITAGAPPPIGMVVRHVCDNPPCVRPDHLLIGTQRDNVRDMVERGRARGGGPVGELQYNSKLTEDDVREIRRRYVPNGYGKTKTLALEFGVTAAAISAIGRGKNWKHVA